VKGIRGTSDQLMRIFLANPRRSLRSHDPQQIRGPGPDHQNSLTVGERGPVLLQDVYYFTKADTGLGKRIADGLKL